MTDEELDALIKWAKAYGTNKPHPLMLPNGEIELLPIAFRMAKAGKACAEVIGPKLNSQARHLLMATADAEDACGDSKVAGAIRFMLEKEDKLSIVLAQFRAAEEGK